MNIGYFVLLLIWRSKDKICRRILKLQAFFVKMRFSKYVDISNGFTLTKKLMSFS